MKTTVEQRLSNKTDLQLMDICNFLGHKNGSTYLPGMDIQYIYNCVCDELESRGINLQN